MDSINLLFLFLFSAHLDAPTFDNWKMFESKQFFEKFVLNEMKNEKKLPELIRQLNTLKFGARLADPERIRQEKA